VPGNTDLPAQDPQEGPSTNQAPEPRTSASGLAAPSTVVLAQVLLAVLVAIGTSAAAYCSDQATSARQSQAREVLRRDQAVIELARHISQTEAGRNFLIAWVCSRTEVRFSAELPDAVRSRLFLDAAAAVEAVSAWARASDGSDGILHECGVGDDGYDPVERLAAQSPAELPAALPPDSDPGKVWAVAAVVAACVPPTAVVAFLIMMQAGRRARRSGSQAIDDDDDLGLIEQPWRVSADPAVRIELTVAWMLLITLPVIQVALGLSAGHQRARADIQGAGLYSSIGASGQLMGFRAHSQELASMVAALGLARQFVALDPDNADVTDEETALGVVEATQGEALEARAAEMGRDPKDSDGLDRDLRRALLSDPADWEDSLAAQQNSARRATELGAGSDRVQAGILIAALVSTALTLARVDTTRTALYARLCALMLLAALALALFGLSAA